MKQLPLLTLFALLSLLFPLVVFLASSTLPQPSAYKKIARIRNQVTLGIKVSSASHFRTLLGSLAPGFRVLVQNDGVEALTSSNQSLPATIKVIDSKEDVSMDMITTKYMIYAVDDYGFSEATNILRMVTLMEKFSSVDVAGGLVSGRLIWAFKFRLSGGILYQNSSCEDVDIIPNFVIARVQSIRQIRYGSDFFLRALNRLSVFACYCFVMDLKHATNVYHGKTNFLSTNDERKRRRRLKYVQDFLERHKIERYYDANSALIASNEKMLRGQMQEPTRVAKQKLEYWLQQNTVTAVLISWKRRQNIRTILKYLESVDCVNEVVVWNNDPSRELTDLESSGNFRLKVVNSPENFNTFGRWKACSDKATNPLCFFIDDDFLPSSIKQLLYTFNRYPNRLAAATNVKVFWNNQRWAFYDSEEAIHTGFSWLGSGSLVSKEIVKSFVQRSLSDSRQEHLPIIDNYFSLWMNQYPAMLIAELDTGKLDQTNAFSIGSKVINKLEEARIAALEILEQKAKGWFGPSREKFGSIPAMAASVSRSSIFFTNKRPVGVGPSSLARVRDKSLWSYIHLPSEARAISPDMELHFEHHSLHSPLAAVDGNEKTYWESQSEILRGDFFGLDLMRIGPIGRIHLLTKTGHQELRVSISSDDNVWFEFNFLNRIEIRQCVSKVTDCVHLILPLSDFDGRFIKFVAGWNYGEPFKVYELYAD